MDGTTYLFLTVMHLKCPKLLNLLTQYLLLYTSISRLRSHVSRLIHHPNRAVQDRGKGDPQDVWHHQVSCEPVFSIKINCCSNDCR